MKTRKTFEIEIERNNVTPAQFLAYLRSQQKKHPEMSSDFDLAWFRSESWCSEYHDGNPDEKPCASEIVKEKPYEKQTYIRNFDGSCFNEIIEFDFWDETTGHGYYYTVNVEVDEEDKEANTAEMLAGIAQRAERKAERNEKKAAEIREYIETEGEWLTDWYKTSQTTEAEILDREAAELREKAAACRRGTAAETEPEAEQETDGETETATDDSTEAEEAETVQRVTWWDAEAVRRACVRNDLYTRGDCSAYSAMLESITGTEPTDKELLRVAKDIQAHSEDQSITNVMYILYHEAVTTTFCINGNCEI